MKYIKPLIPLAYLIILLAAFSLAMSTARDTMQERVNRCAEVAAIWAMYGPRDAVMCDYGESGRDVWAMGGAW